MAGAVRRGRVIQGRLFTETFFMDAEGSSGAAGIAAIARGIAKEAHEAGRLLEETEAPDQQAIQALKDIEKKANALADQAEGEKSRRWVKRVAMAALYAIKELMKKLLFDGFDGPAGP